MNRNKIYDNDLLDYYGVLLTDRQNEMLELYLEDDLSMSEIAEKLNISKTAVADLINRTYKTLDLYENKLKLIELAKKRDSIYDNMLKEFESDSILSYIKELRELK